MAIIKPFKAFIPHIPLVSKIASLPYDVYTREEAKRETEHCPLSYLHITKSEIDLPLSISPYDMQVYEKAKENLLLFIKQNYIQQSSTEAYYIYQLSMTDNNETEKKRTQIGLVALSSLIDYEHQQIKKHELTRPDKELDRINHIHITNAQTGNVFLAYPSHAQLENLIDNYQQTNNPLFQFTTPDNISHTAWSITNPVVITQITSLFEKDIPITYIADGHHRIEAAFKTYKQYQKDPWVMTTLFPAHQLRIMDYNRLIKDLATYSDATSFINALSHIGTVRASKKAIAPKSPNEFGMYINQQWYQVIIPTPTQSSPIESLGVSLLQDKILCPLLAIHNPRTDQRISFMGGIHGLSALEKKVNAKEMAIAFSVCPVTMQQLFDIVKNNQIMPPKSTWFEPKLRDGLFTYMYL